MEITLKKLKEYYNVYSLNKGKTLAFVSLTEKGLYTPMKFMGHAVKIKSKQYQVPGFEPTSNLEVFLQNLVDYTKSLKYNSEFYNPFYCKGYFEYMTVHSYLCDTLGFTHDCDAIFSLQRKNVYGGTRENITINIVGLDYNDARSMWSNGLSDTVSIVLYTESYSWVEIKGINKHPDDIIPQIDSLLKPLLLVDSVNDLKKAEQLKMEDINPTMNQLTNLFDVVESDAKNQLIKTLEETLQTLKSK